MAALAIRASAGWLGPGRLVEDPVVVIDGGRVVFAGTGADPAVVADRDADGRRDPAGRAGASPESDEEIRVDGFLMPGVVDRHVHIGLSDPGAVVAGRGDRRAGPGVAARATSSPWPRRPRARRSTGR